jgi:hypothetical protein
MYLFQLDSKTGLIKDDINNDGWKAINDFKAVVDKDGLKGLTLVALSCDYLSPLRGYSENDRPYRAMEEIYDSRKKIDLNTTLYRKAFIKYKSLQKNNDLEYDAINAQIESDLLDRYAYLANQEVPDQAALSSTHTDLSKHKERIKKFNETFNKDSIIEQHAVAQNGYVLSRIERDIKSRRNSKFTNPEKKLENPNKLGLVEED